MPRKKREEPMFVDNISRLVLSLLMHICVDVQSGKFGIPDENDLMLIGRLHAILEDNDIKASLLMEVTNG